MQLQITSLESKVPNEYSDGLILIQIDQHLKTLLEQY